MDVTINPFDEMFEYAEWLERQVSLYEFYQSQEEELQGITEIIIENMFDLFED